MCAYAEGIRAIFRYPIICGETRVHKIEYIFVYRIALQANFRRYNGIGIWRFVDSAARHGRKLRAVFFIENNAVNAVWELRARHAVEHHVTHGNFAAKSLCTAFRIYTCTFRSASVDVVKKAFSHRASACITGANK